VEGIDSDMMHYILGKLGIPKSELFLSEFSGLIPALQYGGTLLVAKGNPHRISTLEDLTKGRRVASYLESNLQDWVDELGKGGSRLELPGCA
jgi:ABC-type amino acid transport substrate-binding protein